MATVVDFECDPGAYRHWAVSYEGSVATVTLRVDPAGGLGAYDLKLNSYDLVVDIQLADIVQPLRFEHPEVHAVVGDWRASTRSSAPAPTSRCWRAPRTRQGQLRQVHQRDPARHRGRHRPLGPDVAGGGQRHGRRRRIRAGPRLRRDRSHRRPHPRRCPCPRCRCSASCRAPVA